MRRSFLTRIRKNPFFFFSLSKPLFYSLKDRLFSLVFIRLFFLLLFFFDLIWFSLSLPYLLFWSLNVLFTLGKIPSFKEEMKRQAIIVRRSLSLLFTLFLSVLNPNLGILVTCTYFLIYDKAGIERVVSSSLRDQCRGFFK
jgi:hypothetical protein